VVIGLLPVAFFFVAAYQRRWMHDDGFINLRVVRNVLDGYGPVFNIGERVEASTSPLWIYVLVAAGALGFRLEGAAVYGGLALATGGVACAVLAAYCRSGASGELRPGPRPWLLPLGATAFVVLPPAWDYATSGLETGFALLWLGASYATVVALSTKGGTLLWWLAAMLLGLGWLIRPEFALYAAALFLPLARGFDARFDARRGMASRLRRLLLLVVAAVAIPGAYQIFRMGYYGALTANPAIAKEAFVANWQQGWCYFWNFFGLYWWAAPAAVLALFYFLAARRGSARFRVAESSGMGTVMTPLLVAAASAHVLYVIAIGGDYMHGRMFIPAVFAATMPLSVVAIDAAARKERILRSSSAAVLAAWAVLCATRLRPDPENQCDIGDERAWYVRLAETDNPIEIDDYRRHPFHAEGADILRTSKANCPSIATWTRGPRADCRRTIVLGASEEESRTLVTRPLNHAIGAVAVAGAVGMVGFVLPSAVHLVDRHGLADPIGARLALADERDRPGHEKRLSDAWVLARFTKPLFLEDAAVAAARNALGCGQLQALVRDVRARLTGELFLQNIARASRMQRLRVPSDAFAAEVHFCNVPAPTLLTAGGAGGSPFESRCPVGTDLVGVHGSQQDEHRAIAHWVPICRAPASVVGDVDTAAGDIAGPPAGEPTEHRFDLRCPTGSLVLGFFGRTSWIVNQLGLICTGPRGSDGENVRTAPVGFEEGAPFQLVCPEGALPMGVAGRAGALLDAAGIACGSPPERGRSR
jgi:arabinofuranosyltransferase